MKKRYLIVLLFALLFLTGCQSKPKENPIVTMNIKDYGTIKIELYPKIAYNTVANFVNLVESGYYNGNAFHRLVKGFVLQGGDASGTGIGGPGYSIKGEFTDNGFNNKLSHTTGIVSMARLNTDYDSAGGQFFIVLSDNHTQSLDGKYAAFGKVIKGMEIIQEIANADLKFLDEESGMLEDLITIEKTTVDTKGYTYTVEKIVQ